MARTHDCGTKPDDPVEAALWTFATLANWTALHPEDDNRFYEFIVLAVQNKSQWQPGDVGDWLLERGLPKRLADSLAERFWIGRCALVKRERMHSGNDEVVY